MAAGLPHAAFREIVGTVLEALKDEGYLQEALGYECVDAGHVEGRLGVRPGLHFLQRMGKDPIPFEESIPFMEPDDLFDLIEALHDLVSEGVQDPAAFHSYNGCGWHFRTFDQAAGQERLRRELNPLLLRLKDPMRLTENGVLEDVGPATLEPLLSARLPASLAGPDFQDRVDTAVAHYRRARAGIDQRRAAVRELADVLEFLRPEMKRLMLKKDEGAIFDLANNFAIRHHNRDQRGDYDSAIWLSWAFYTYLATIHANAQLLDRERRKTSKGPAA